MHKLNLSLETIDTVFLTSTSSYFSVKSALFQFGTPSHFRFFPGSLIHSNIAQASSKALERLQFYLEQTRSLLYNVCKTFKYLMLDLITSLFFLRISKCNHGNPYTRRISKNNRGKNIDISVPKQTQTHKNSGARQNNRSIDFCQLKIITNIRSDAMHTTFST